MSEAGTVTIPWTSTKLSYPMAAGAFLLFAGIVTVVVLAATGYFSGDDDEDDSAAGGGSSEVPVVNVTTSVNPGTVVSAKSLKRVVLDGNSQKFAHQVAMAPGGDKFAVQYGAGVEQDFVLYSLDAAMGFSKLGNYVEAGLAATTHSPPCFNKDGSRLLTAAAGTNIRDMNVFNTVDGKTTTVIDNDIAVTAAKSFSRAFFDDVSGNTILGVNVDDGKLQDAITSDGVTWAAGSVSHPITLSKPEAIYKAGNYIYAIDSAGAVQAECYALTDAGVLVDAAGLVAPDNNPIVKTGGATWGNSVCGRSDGKMFAISETGESKILVYTRASRSDGWSLTSTLTDADGTFGTFGELMAMNDRYLFTCGKKCGSSGKKVWIYEIKTTGLVLKDSIVINDSATDTHTTSSISVSSARDFAVVSEAGTVAGTHGRAHLVGYV